MFAATLVEVTCKRTGKPVWAVDFTDRLGRELRTNYTTIREEACMWGRFIRDHGWATGGNGYPRAALSQAA